MTKSKDAETQGSNEKLNFKEPSEQSIDSLTKITNNLSIELEAVKENVKKRKIENTSLKVLFYTGLVVLLLGFLYSNSELQRAHMRSLERNIISVEQRISQDMNRIKIKLELDIQDIKKLNSNENDIFTILRHMDYAISQIHPKKERAVTLINQVRLDTDKFRQALKNEMTLKNNDKLLIN